MDPNFTEQLKAYLAQPENERDIAEGAMLLLRLDRNKARYDSYIRNRNIPIYRRGLFSRLNRHLKIRLDGLTVEEVARMEPVADEAAKAVEQAAVVNEAGEVIDHRGKRADHDRLPEKAQLQYRENLAVMNKMRRLRTEIDIKRQQGAMPCDLYELLKQLLDLDAQRLQNWADYDAAVPVPPADGEPAKPDAGTAASESADAATADTAEGSTADAAEVAESADIASADAAESNAADAAKEMGSARTYISRNLAALEDLSKDETRQVEFATKKEAMQKRYARLVELGGNVKDETAARLNALGISV